MLFAKTNNIFKGWATNLLSFCLQPMILFAYIAVFITVMDKALIGSAIFVGQAPAKTISCEDVCKNADGTTAQYTGPNLDQPPACDKQGQRWIDPKNDSVACLINVDDFGKFPGLELLGLSIPILDNLFSSNVKEKILTMLKGGLVMYLLYKFMDEIPGIISKLVGGTPLPGSTSNAADMFKTMGTSLAAIQKRTSGLGKKVGKKGAQLAKEALRKGGDKGKSESDDKGEKRPDGVGSSRGGSDGAGKSGGNADSAGKSGAGGDGVKKS
jgi:type IV secretory pathway VirB6-like protein